MLKGKSQDRNTADNLTMKAKDGFLKVHKTIVYKKKRNKHDKKKEKQYHFSETMIAVRERKEVKRLNELLFMK